MKLSFNDFCWYIFGIIILFFYLKDNPAKRLQKRLNNKEFPPQIPFNSNFDKSWPIWKKYLFNIYCYSFIVVPIILFLYWFIIPFILI